MDCRSFALTCPYSNLPLHTPGAAMTTVRKGQVAPFISREAFRQRFQQSFYDPAFDAERAALDRIENIAWDAYKAARKAPRTVKAGDEFADPDYDISIEWLETRRRV